MHYVRLLKPPAITTAHGRPQFSLLFTIQTDLGDQFYPCDIGIKVSLSAGRGVGHATQQIFSKTYPWRATDRQVTVSTTLNQWRPSSLDQVVVKLSPDCTADVIRLPKGRAGIPSNAHFALPPVLGLQTYPFNATRESCPRIALRPIPTFDQDTFMVAEELGESIARHVWDAGVAAAVYFGQSNSASPSVRDQGGLHSLLAALHRRSKTGNIRVLELGAGVGLVGCAAASSMANVHAVLSDLDEAEELIEANAIALEKRGNGRPVFHALDWTQELPQSIQSLRLDLVVASDCTYNPDFSPALVKVISELELLSPGVPVMIAAKERHPSEQIFLDKMQEEGFKILHHEIVISPLAHGENSLDDAEHIDLYIFNRSAA